MKFDLSFTKAPVTAFVDWYQFTMLQAMQHQLDHNGGIRTRMKYSCRTKGANTARLKNALQEALSQFEDRHVMLPEEIKHLRQHVPYMKPVFLETLRDLRLHPVDVVQIEERDGELDISIEGPIQTILFEHLILSVISELWSQLTFTSDHMEGASDRGIEVLHQEVENIQKGDCPLDSTFRLIEGGTRRRFSLSHHEKILTTLKELLPNQLFGTSNVHLAIKNNLRLVGTQAHLFGMLFQQHGGTLATFPTRAMQAWVNEYRGDLGYMLPDILTTEAWLQQVDLYFAKLFDGFRHDSGDPHVWTRNVLNRLTELNINSATKFAVYSDGLTLQKASELWRRYEGRPWKTSYLIGTFLTNNVPGHKALSQVIKLTAVNGQPVAKLSDEPQKAICESNEFLAALKKTFDIT